MQGLSLGWGPGASLVLGLPKALPRHRARTPSQEGAGQARGAGPQQQWASCGPRRMASPQPLGARPQHVITEEVAWDSWPSAVIRRGAPGAPGRPEHRRPPEPGARPPALCLPTSLPPAPSSATSCPVSCLWPQDAPLPNSSFPGALWQVHEAGRACLLCRGTMWLGTWATGRRRRPLGALGHVPGSCWTQMASSQAQHRDSLRGKDMPRLSPAGLSCCHLAPASTPGPGPAEPGPTCAYPSSAPGMAFRTSTWQASPHPLGPRPAVSSTGLPRAPPLCGARPFLFLPGLGPWEPPDMASSPVVTATLPRTWLPTSPRGPEAQPAYSLSCERVKKAVARTPKAEAGLSGLGGGGAPRQAASTSQEWGGPHPQTAGPSSRNFPTPQSPEPNKHRLSIIYKTI